MWYVCDVLYAVLYVSVSCFIVRGCAVSRRYIKVCNCDICSVVNVFCRRYVCCGECYVVSDECDESIYYYFHILLPSWRQNVILS